MEERITKGKNVIVEKLVASKATIIDVPKIIVNGKKEVTIENHKGIITFKDNEIKINTAIGPVTIVGEKFEILYIATSTIIVSGKFILVKFEE